MSKIDVVKENLQFQQFIRENTSKSILKDEYLIPDTHPDVEEILMVEVNTIIINKEVTIDKVIVEGKVEYNIIYIPREDSMMINSVKYTEDFSNSIELEDSEHKINCEIECKLEHIQSKVMNERKIEIGVELVTCYEIYKDIDFEIVKNVEATSGIQVLKNVEPINRLVMNKDFQLISKSMIRVGMDKPQVYKILNYYVSLHKKEVKIIEDKLLMSCYCKLNILYLGGENKEVISLDDDVYISKEEEISSLEKEMIPYGIFQLENIDLVIEEDDLGEARIINTEFIVKSTVKSFTNENIDLIQDVYCTKFPVEITKENHQLSLINNIKSIESVVKDNIYIKEGDLKPEYIQYVSAYVVNTNKSIMDNKINLEGTIFVSVLYKTASEEKGYGKLSGEIPFTMAMDIGNSSGDMKSVIKCELDSIEAYIEANTIGIRATLIGTVKVSHKVNKEFICNVIEGEGEVPKKNASITIYLLDKDEKLWDLAKKFNTTVDELVKVNSLEDPESIQQGEKLIIPGRAVF